MELLATLIVGVFIYWPPFILMYVRTECIEWYEKSRLRVTCCPSMLAVWVTMFIFHTIAFAAWLLHTFAIPSDGMIISEFMIAGIVLYFLHMGTWHCWFSCLFVHMKTRAAFAWSVFAMLSTIATAVMFLFDGELISTILMFIAAAIGIALCAITGKLWWCDPCAPEGALRKKVACGKLNKGVEQHHHQPHMHVALLKGKECDNTYQQQQQQQYYGSSSEDEVDTGKMSPYVLPM